MLLFLFNLPSVTARTEFDLYGHQHSYLSIREAGCEAMTKDKLNEFKEQAYLVPSAHLDNPEGQETWGEASCANGGREDKRYMCLKLSQYCCSWLSFGMLLWNGWNKMEGATQRKSDSKSRSEGSSLPLLGESFSSRTKMPSGRIPGHKPLQLTPGDVFRVPSSNALGHSMRVFRAATTAARGPYNGDTASHTSNYNTL